jgi:ribosome modulation factor
MVVTFGGCPWGRARQRKYGVRPNQRLPQQQGATAAPPQEGSPITIKEAFELGYHAYWGGVALDRNPYDQGKDVEKFQSWIAGWCEAQEHDYVR